MPARLIRVGGFIASDGLPSTSLAIFVLHYSSQLSTAANDVSVG